MRGTLKTLATLGAVVALALSAMAGHAPGHTQSSGTLQGEAVDTENPELGSIRYLFNRAGYHFWFTPVADVADFEEGDSYHSIYKYKVDDPENWCFLPGRNDDGREPYNLGGTIREDKYYKIWNETDGESLCGTFDIASGDVTYVPSGEHLTDATFGVKVSEAGAQGGVTVSNHWQGGDKNVNFTGNVACSQKVGDVVYFAGPITSSENVTSSPTGYFYFSIEDGSPDLIRVLRSETWQPCDYAGAPIREVVTGDLMIY